MVKNLRFNNWYLRGKRVCRRESDIAKRGANRSSIDSAINPCKAAWDLGNCNSKLRSNCNATPDEFIQILLGEVDGIGEPIPRVKLDAASLGSIDLAWALMIVLCLLWSGTELHPPDVAKAVNEFKSPRSIDIFGVSIVALKHVAVVIALVLSRAPGCLGQG